MTNTVRDSHARLMHYTTGTGLKGIIESGSLWASNARFLNDSQEIVHYFEARLPSLTREVAETFVDRICTDPSKAGNIEKLGGKQKLVADAVSKLVDHLKQKTLRYIDPFILSLSAPADELVSVNGLLSQWRAYGSDGGYAIVFETRRLEQFLRDEEKRFHYQHFEWGDVYYYGASNDQPAAGDVEELESKLREEIERMIDHGSPKSHMDVYFALTALSCLSKHWGFSEEREVRIVAIPQKDESEIINTDSIGRSKKEVRHHAKGGTLVPHLALEGMGAPMGRLPIELVIVGPHKDKELRRASAETLLRSNGYDAPAVVSAIPYLGG